MVAPTALCALPQQCVDSSTPLCQQGVPYGDNNILRPYPWTVELFEKFLKWLLLNSVRRYQSAYCTGSSHLIIDGPFEKHLVGPLSPQRSVYQPRHRREGFPYFPRYQHQVIPEFFFFFLCECQRVFSTFLISSNSCEVNCSIRFSVV